MSEQATGTVKWFDPKKGFGFIARDDGDDLFVHHTALTGNGFRTLNENDSVEFDIEKDDKGERAINVKVSG
tara:strand:+ start:4665 stop:4877 length:213 start_codon:yes stop_codon:yes gene_type:complete